MISQEKGLDPRGSHNFRNFDNMIHKRAYLYHCS